MADESYTPQEPWEGRTRFLCHFCNIVILSNEPTVEDALLHHLKTCMAEPHGEGEEDEGK